MEKLLKYWQTWAYLITVITGVGITGYIARDAVARITVIERDGTGTAKHAATEVKRLEIRVDRLENENRILREALARIEEKVVATKDTLARIERILEGRYHAGNGGAK